MQISGATVLLTGATGGIGHAIARALHERGAELILTGRRTEVLEPLADELGARALAIDLSDCPEVERLLRRGRGDRHPRRECRAAGVAGAWSPSPRADRPRARRQPTRADRARTRAAAGDGRARARAPAVRVLALPGKAATPGASLYCASKFGMRGFALRLRADLHGSGVGVSTVFPGFIRDAGMFADSGVKLPPGVGTRTPEDVARAVVPAIERNRAEVDVAPLALRAGAIFAGLAPEIAASVSRRLRLERTSRARWRRGSARSAERGAEPRQKSVRLRAQSSARMPRGLDGGVCARLRRASAG